MESLLYIANSRIPTEKAHGLQIMKMCEAFANLGVEVELVVPKRKNTITEDPLLFYGLSTKFKITYLPVIDTVSFGKIGFLLESISFTFSLIIYSYKKRKDVYFGRDYMPLFFLSFFKKNIYWETHRGEWNVVVASVVKRVTNIITITQGLKNFYVNKGVSSEKIEVLPDAVDVEEFTISLAKEECRTKLGLPQGDIAMYAGHLYDWKGADTFAEAAILIPEVQAVFVGGTDEDILAFKKKYGSYPNIHILGRKPHKDIPYFLKAADVLILPNSAKKVISELYTSPMKLFEYMASGTPIVASSLPSLREVLTEQDAVFVSADNPKDLSEGIIQVLQNKQVASDLARSAYQKVLMYNWQHRAEKILK